MYHPLAKPTVGEACCPASQASEGREGLGMGDRQPGLALGVRKGPEVTGLLQ